ncbi:MAG: GNAT family N-acetyltransferase [Pseudomonas sp.]|uniref:GNAT family N-acetyltransferase n=1 Tax=Pseudomonas abieticivorans TaxID=2931382 RepID=UPI0020BE5421|nr:GNAT family N-acetyltransferase [Pseudomonas sp. PIA16]MDE1168833.1 GNAT family N-acetyltransferase [Pseudomonas sp.]
MSAIEIRPVSSADHQHWLPLWQAYQRFYQTQIPQQVSDVTWQRMLDPAEPINAALAWENGKAIGMVHFIYHRSCWTVENSCYLQDLIVADGQRGKGIGRQLIEHVYATARENDCVKVHWLTHETNATAILLYERIAERPGFIQFRQAL